MPSHPQQSLPSAMTTTTTTTRRSDDLPKPQDVIFGRGTPYMTHVGNLALHELTDQYMPLYKSFGCKSAGVVQRIQKYGKSTKQEIVDGIIDAIHDKGGRFLRKDSETGQWVQVSHQEARTKVCHILRGRARRKTTGKQTSPKKKAASIAATSALSSHNDPKPSKAHPKEDLYLPRTGIAVQSQPLQQAALELAREQPIPWVHSGMPLDGMLQAPIPPLQSAQPMPVLVVPRSLWAVPLVNLPRPKIVPLSFAYNDGSSCTYHQVAPNAYLQSSQSSGHAGWHSF